MSLSDSETVMNAPPRDGPHWSFIPASICIDALLFCYLGGLIVTLGVVFGVDYLAESRHHDSFRPPGRIDELTALTNWDGNWYLRIARDGYSYRHDRMSSVAFFPAYPLLGRALAWATGMPYSLTLAVLSNLFLWATAALLMDYTRRRFPDAPAGLPTYTALALTLFPLGFFFRVAYSESLFLFLTVLTLYGLQRRWPITVVALIVGLATATRATGVALIPPLVFAAWQRYPSWPRLVPTLIAILPLSVWGLAAYATYQAYAFGEPLAFSQAQVHWRFRPDVPFTENLWAVATGEPIWSVYDPTSPAWWARHDKHLSPPFSLQFANPIYFLSAAAFVAVGAWMRWLGPAEVLLAVGLLAVPYVTRSYYACMTAHARYAAAVFPVYLVLGQLLTRLSPGMAAAALSMSGFMLGVYAALFAGRYFLL